MSPLLNRKNHGHQFFFIDGLQLSPDSQSLAIICYRIALLERTAPISNPDASSSITKHRVKSGIRNTGSVVRAFCEFWKATVASGHQRKASFLSCCVRGWAMLAYPLMNLR